MLETLQNKTARDETKHTYAVHVQRRHVMNTSYPYILDKMYYIVTVRVR